MTVLYENPHEGNFILSEDDEGRLSRDKIVVASGAGKLRPGTVLGKLTASGKFAPSPETGVNGSETAVAVLVGGVDATSADAVASSKQSTIGTETSRARRWSGGVSCLRIAWRGI
jgi:Bacteriophage lambda head decoration protein D